MVSRIGSVRSVFAFAPLTWGVLVSPVWKTRGIESPQTPLFYKQLVHGLLLCVLGSFNNLALSSRLIRLESLHKLRRTLRHLTPT